MNKHIILFGFISFFMIAAHSLASSHGGGHGHMTSGSGDMGHGVHTAHFTHEVVSEGIRTEFQIMSLASMNMKDPDGATHHVMVKFFQEPGGDQIKNVRGKVKIIGPEKKSQEQMLKDYSGIFAANFTFPVEGKYGVICLFKSGDKKRVVKFWYPHKAH